MKLYDIDQNGKLKPGDLIAVKMTSIGYWDIFSNKIEDGFIPDFFKNQNDFQMEDGTDIKDFIIVLKYIGEHKFMELCSGKTMILDFASFNFCTDDYITYPSDLNNLNYNDEEFEKDYKTALNNPLSPIIYGDASLEEEFSYVAFVYDDEARKKYNEETTPNQKYIVKWFNDKEKLAREKLTNKYNQMMDSLEPNKLL